MTKKVRWVMLSALMLLAILCYISGVVNGAIVLITLGMLLEGVFWFNLLKDMKTKRNTE